MNTIDFLKNTQVDMYRNASNSNTIWYRTSLYDFIGRIAVMNKQKIQTLRSLNMQDEKVAKQYKKHNIPACCISAQCNNVRTLDDIKSYTGIIAIDIDKDNNEGLDVVKAKQHIMQSLPFVMMTSLSCRGEGIFCLVKYDTSNKLLDVFNALYDDFYELGYIVDDNTTDEVRLRFVSWDSDIQIRNEVITYCKAKETAEHLKKKTVKQHDDNVVKDWNMTSNDMKDISVAIWMLVNHCGYKADTYNEWLCDCFRLAAMPNKDVGKQLFRMISEHSKGFESYDACDRKYEQCMNTRCSTSVLGYYINKVKENFGAEWRSVANDMLRKNTTH